MTALTVQNFVSAAAGMATVAALIRGLARRRASTIGNKGLLPASGPRRRNVGAAGYLHRKRTLCPDCLRTRQIPVVRVSGNVPELLVAALGEGAEIAEIGPDIGPVFAFQAVVRVA